MNTQVDPIKFEVISSALVEATEEMALVLQRSAYSTNVKTRGDISVSFFDRNLRHVCKAHPHSNHIGFMVKGVPQAIEEYGPENLGPGDAILNNDPYRGGTHLNDICCISPLFYEGKIFGYLANTAHHVDVGGGSPGSAGACREVYQEGTIIPPVRLVKGGEIVSDVFRLILAQVRSPHETGGDFRAQIAANNTGLRRMTGLLERFGADTVNFYIEELLAYTERVTRAGLAKLPRGEYVSEGYLDNDGFTDQPIHLVVRVVSDDEGVLFDFTGCDPQRKAPINATYTMTFGACAYALKCLVDPGLPANHGSYGLVRMIAPLGSVVNARPPAAVVAGYDVSLRLVELIFKALAAALPERMPAGTKGMLCGVGFGGLSPRTGQYYVFPETLGAGYGARASRDGLDAVQTHSQNSENAPVEETEINYPVRITRYELVEDSEGAGRFRGGLGLRRDYLFPDHEATFSILGDRDRWGPHGLFGGLSGEPARYLLVSKGETHTLGSRSTTQVEPGDVVSIRTCGGGGYGPPRERDPQRVLTDVREGKVSPERAREVYGVAVDTTRWVVDEAETASLRGYEKARN